MNSLLDKIATHKQAEIADAKRTKPWTALQENAVMPVRDFNKALRHKAPAIIAEIKKASPSKGVICQHFHVDDIAESYEAHGAACLSVLTDVAFFQGHPSYLEIAKHHSSLPILRKDFIIDAYQIYESRALGADCILLIVAMLDDIQLHDFCQLANELGMAILVESHTQEELERALRLPTPLMGINNRSLHTFHTNVQVSIDLKSLIPDDKLVISESGIHTSLDIKRLQSHGIHTFLIGETLMRANNPGECLQRLLTE